MSTARWASIFLSSERGKRAAFNFEAFEGPDAKTILKALADDAETMHIAVTDTRTATVKLELTIPVAEKQAEFKALLTGLK